MQPEENEGLQEVYPQLGAKQDNAALYGLVFPSMTNEKV